MGQVRNVTDHALVVFIGCQRQTVEPEGVFTVEEEAMEAYSNCPEVYQPVVTPIAAARVTAPTTTDTTASSQEG